MKHSIINDIMLGNKTRFKLLYSYKEHMRQYWTLNCTKQTL